MYFAIYALDRPNSAALRAQLRPGHRQRLRAHDHPVRVVIAGPLLGDDEAMLGTLLIVEADRASDVTAYWNGDPYMINGLFERVDIRPFAWGLGTPPPETHTAKS